ncbi:putative inorganic phosphate cotransporter isoform X2 [Stegodyphus dumicola]|uniref:putative inorganic phosphate cotransporter isoform X2 n=1 Tax=Stegodyphus dumicola TaxID=202533 RepID=UPI0015A7C9C7|nr:putative inorganic phosphate cotransporter isoform X2 [Stegodyphus dumicola]
MNELKANEPIHVHKLMYILSLGFIPKRFILCIVGILAVTLAISLNANLSIAIISMVDRRNESSANVIASNECKSEENINVSWNDVQLKPLEHHGDLQWSAETEGYALSSLYYGQLLGFIPGGRMAEVYGGKKTLIFALAFASLLTAALPWMARASAYAFFAGRFVIGIMTAPTVPVLFYLISRWIPVPERSFSTAFVFSGLGLGSFVSFLYSGVLCASEILGGWPLVFYVGGLSGFVWCILCSLLVFETPENHPTISKKELQFITNNLGPAPPKMIKKVPVKSIMLSIPFWALAIGYFGQFWILGLYNVTPSLYMGTILNVDSETNGELSSLPPLTRALFACLCSTPVDWAIKKGYLEASYTRKGTTLVNSILFCVGMIGVLLAKCNLLLTITSFTVGGILGNCVTFGVCMAAIDIAPNLSGTLSGILGTIGVIPFFAVPTFIGWLTKYERSMTQWSYFYYSTIGVVIITTIVFLVFGSSKPQSWGVNGTESTEEGKAEDVQEPVPAN